MRKSDKLKNMKRVNTIIESRLMVMKESAIDGKYSNKSPMVNAIINILKAEGVEGRYTDEHWEGITKLKNALKKHGLEYDFIKANYEYNNDETKTQLPNSKIYVFSILVMSKQGKPVMLPLRVTCAFVGQSGTMVDGTYELTYYFMV